MNKGDLIEALAAEIGQSKAGAQRIVDAVFGCIVAGVHRDQKVSITGFGTFKKKTRKARIGINPVTKEPMEIRASTTIGFTPSELLRNNP